MKYKTPRDFERAIKDHAARRSQETGKSIQRQRKLIAIDRLMARFAVADVPYLVKGGFVLEVRLERARTTKDIDLSLYGDTHDLIEQVRRVVGVDIGDFFEFEVGPPKEEDKGTITGPAAKYGGVRLHCTAKLGGKKFEEFGLDVAIADPPAPDPDYLFSIDSLVFADIEPVQHPMISREHHIAQKLHAYTLPRDRENSRVKDLPDLGLLALTGPLSKHAVRAAIDVTFTNRTTHHRPARLPPPPANWAKKYTEIAEADELPWPTLDAVYAAARAFIDPVLAEPSADDAIWDLATWSWR